MTVQIRSDEKDVQLLVEGDIYDDHAECIKDMTFAYARRGIKKLDIQLCSTYYISTKGQKCLQVMRDCLDGQGVQVSFKPNL